MNQNLALADYLVFIVYFIIVAGYGYSIYHKRKKDEHDAKAYFLAEGTLTWWAIGASLIASNISAEQFIGMSGEGFFLGIAVAAYEWIAAVALIIVAVFFIPVYLKNHIYTMPQFLKTRYNESVALIMAVFWLFLYVFVNLTSILYLGAVAINGLAGGTYLHTIMIGLAVFALLISLGGMKVVAYTDVIQVAVLIIGGLVTTYISLTTVGEYFGVGQNAIAGFKVLMKEAPEHFKMIIPKPGADATQNEFSKYLTFPGFLSYMAGIWIINLNYWGCNQYITQRALGADLQTARTGILFAGFLKLLMPLIVMLPGIAAFVIYKGNHLPQLVGGKDGAYSAMLTFLPTGLKGLSVAALTAAIVASLAGKVNSISTIYTLDIHKKYLQKGADEKKQVYTGRIAVFIAMILAVLFTWNDLLGIGGVGGFTYIQKYTGFISPGIFAMFVLGMFWKRTTAPAALAGILMGFLLSVFFNEFAPKVMGKETVLYTAYPSLKVKDLDNQSLLNDNDKALMTKSNAAFAAFASQKSSATVSVFAEYGNGKTFTAITGKDSSDTKGFCASKKLLDSFYTAHPGEELENFVIANETGMGMSGRKDQTCRQDFDFTLQKHKPFHLVFTNNTGKMIVYEYVYEIPFHICMGLSFFFTFLTMIIISMAGPKINPKAFELDSEMFKLKPATVVMILVTLLLIMALYVKFW